MHTLLHFTQYWVLRLVQALQGLTFEVPKAKKCLSLLTLPMPPTVVVPDCLKARIRRGVADKGKR